jgi:hypothetical protein
MGVLVDKLCPLSHVMSGDEILQDEDMKKGMREEEKMTKGKGRERN